VSWRSLGALGVVLGIIVFALLFIGISEGVPPGLASLVIQTQVFFTIMLGMVVLGERPDLYQWAAMSLSFAGIGRLMADAGGVHNLMALTLIVGAAAAWGVANILMKRMRGVNMLHLMVWMSIIPPIPLFALSIGVEGWSPILTALRGITWLGMGAVAYTGFVSTVLGYGAWGMLLQRYRTSVVTPFALLVPVFGMTLSSLLLGERLTATDLISASLVFIGLALNVYGPQVLPMLRMRRQRTLGVP
jgi:O-acetylserine/cysteine efflux transporter